MNTKGFQIGAIAVTGMMALLAPAGAQTGSGSMGTSDSSMSKPMDHSMTKSDGSMSKGSLKSMDAKFLKMAAQAGMMEVDLGQMAATQATDPDVKAFGQKMVDDHTAAGAKLQALATSKGMTVPTDKSAEETAAAGRLQKLTGPEFDRAYVKQMVTDHKKVVAAFKKAADKASDPDVKAFASETLPTLEDHLKAVQSMQSKNASAKGMGRPGSAAHSNMDNGTGSADTNRAGQKPTDTPPPPVR